MKRFLKRRWHSIPVALVSALLVLTLVAGGAFAFTLIGPVPQTITQEIYAPEDIGTITAEDITLKGVVVGQVFAEDAGTVTVVIAEKGINSWLHLKLISGASPKYKIFSVKLLCPAPNEMGDTPIQLVVLKSGDDASVQLTAAGTYTFTELIGGTAGDTPDAIHAVALTISLEDA